MKSETMPERYARLDAEVKHKRELVEKHGGYAPTAPEIYFPTSFIKGEAHWMET